MQRKRCTGPEPYDSLNLTLRALKYGASPELYATLESDPCQSALDMAQDLSEMGETELAAAILAGLPTPCAQTEYVRWHLTGDRRRWKRPPGLEAGVAYPLREIEHRALTEAAKAHPEDANALDLLACLEYHMENHEKADDLWSPGRSGEPEGLPAPAQSGRGPLQPPEPPGGGPAPAGQGAGPASRGRPAGVGKGLSDDPSPLRPQRNGRLCGEARLRAGGYRHRTVPGAESGGPL